MKLEFLQEMTMMKRVSAGKNPYVVNMIGCCSTQEPLALVLELVPNGNLLEYLKANRSFVSAVHDNVCIFVSIDLMSLLCCVECICLPLQ